LLGIGLAVSGSIYLDHHIPASSVVMQTGRQQLVRNATLVLDEGGPPLLASYVPWKQARKTLPAKVFEANQTDDPGIYLYLPLIGHLTGDSDPISLFKWFFIGSMAVVLLTYPLIFYRLFDSLVMAVLAPLVVLFKFRFLWNTEIAWVPAWAILLGMPIVFLVAQSRWRRRRSLAGLFLVAVVGSYATSIRSAAGIPLVIAAFVVAVAREQGPRWRVLGGLLVVIGYLSINTFGLDAVRAYRDHVAHLHVDRSVAPASHPFWHPAYLGLGYLPNKWGIKWDDSVALAAARKVDPGVIYLSAHYEHILRHLYFKIVRQDPTYVANVYATKAAVSLNDAVRHFWLAFVVAPLSFAFGRFRRQTRRNLLLLTPALLLTLAPPVLTIPSDYEAGWIGSVGLGALLILGWATVTVLAPLSVLRRMAWTSRRPALRTLRQLLSAELSRDRPSGRVLAAAVATVAAFLALGAASAADEASHADAIFYQAGASYLDSNASIGRSVRRWSFGNGIPKGWQLQRGTADATRDATTISTSTGPFEYELISPALKLDSGDYVVRMDGRPLTGGLGLGALDVAQGQWLNISYFWYRQTGSATRPLTVDFEITSATAVQVVLTNWSRVPDSSDWLIRTVELHRQRST
jgi:hypothetical protein